MHGGQCRQDEDVCLHLSFSPGCEGDSNLSMWIYVLLGNVLRGIGETPVQPLGISYIDDFATEENAALYVGKKVMSECTEIVLKSNGHLHGLAITILS